MREDVMRRRARAVKGRVGVSNVVAIFELNCSSEEVWGGSGQSRC